MRCLGADILTKIILAIFRVNGCLLDAGDELVKPLQLTSARWQVIGAVALAGSPLSVPQIAAAMGITRQGIQKQLNVLLADGLLTQYPNPGHKRSPLYTLSERGAQIYGEVDCLQAGWANQLADGLDSEKLKATLTTLEMLHGRLAAQLKGDG